MTVDLFKEKSENTETHLAGTLADHKKGRECWEVKGYKEAPW